VETIKRVELVPLSSGKLVAILVTNTGDVRKHVAAMPEETTDSEVERLAAFLNERLRSLSFSEAISLLNSYDDSAHLVDGELAGVVREMLEEAVAAEYEREVYLDGMENIFDQPEFQDLDSLRPVLRVLDEKKYLNELLEFCVSEDGMTRICIRIGSENPLDDVRGCSIVASPYRIDGRIRGAIGVIGPTRMRYSRASSLVGFVAEQLGAVLTEMC
jgi:heat-inducible transcriptional repressor